MLRCPSLIFQIKTHSHSVHKQAQRTFGFSKRILSIDDVARHPIDVLLHRPRPVDAEAHVEVDPEPRGVRHKPPHVSDRFCSANFCLGEKFRTENGLFVACFTTVFENHVTFGVPKSLLLERYSLHFDTKHTQQNRHYSFPWHLCYSKGGNYSAHSAAWRICLNFWL